MRVCLELLGFVGTGNDDDKVGSNSSSSSSSLASCQFQGHSLDSIEAGAYLFPFTVSFSIHSINFYAFRKGASQNLQLVAF